MKLHEKENEFFTCSRHSKISSSLVYFNVHKANAEIASLPLVLLWQVFEDRAGKFCLLRDGELS